MIGVADLGLDDVLDVAGEEADFADAEASRPASIFGVKMPISVTS